MMSTLLRHTPDTDAADVVRFRNGTANLRPADDHMLPFFGLAHIAYVPDGTILGRGVEKQSSSTLTSSLRGVIRGCPATRKEFLRLASTRRAP